MECNQERVVAPEQLQRVLVELMGLVARGTELGQARVDAEPPLPGPWIEQARDGQARHHQNSQQHPDGAPGELGSDRSHGSGLRAQVDGGIEASAFDRVWPG